MKRITLFSTVCVMLLSFVAHSQPVLKTEVDFENGIPTDWTIRSTNNVSSISTLSTSGEKCVKLKPSTANNDSVYILSPVISIDAGKDTRLEFNHIPMITNTGSAKVVLIANGTATPLSQIGTGNPPTCYDNTYGSGMSSFPGVVQYKAYWNYLDTTISENYLNDSYWRHEVFYLANRLNGATEFQIMFVIPNKGGTRETGWYLDDIKVFEASAIGNEVRIPQITNKLKYPDMEIYPICSASDVIFEIRDANGQMTPYEDSIYILYHSELDPEDKKIVMTTTDNILFSAQIPFLGIDSIIYWKAIINDAMGNVTTYPHTGAYAKYQTVRPFFGSIPLATSGTSSQELIFKTNEKKAMYQMRYSATELHNAGYTSGKINGLQWKINSVPTGNVSSLKDFKIYIALIPSNYPIKDINPYTGVINVYNESLYDLPGIGWHTFDFPDSINFIWDGQSDILIKTCFEGRTPDNVSGATKIEAITASGQYATRRFESSTSAAVACNTTFNPSNPTINYKPNIQFNFVDICHFSYDAGIRTDTISSLVQAKDCNGNLSTSIVCNSTTPASLKFYLRNDGVEPLTSVKVNWMLDDDISTKQSALWTGTMAPIDANFHPVDTMVEFVATNNFISPIGFHKLTVWTEMPDGSGYTDMNYDNDTAYFTVICTDGAMNGNYAIGGNISGITTNKTFNTIDDAVLMMINSGVNGPVTFKMKSKSVVDNDYADTTYIGSWKMPSCVQGVSAINTITFVNETETNIILQNPEFVNNIIDLSDVSYYRFKNLTFSIPAYSPSSLDAIKLGVNSKDIIFEKCIFVDEIRRAVIAGINFGDTTKYAKKINSLINIGAADSVIVRNCLFDVPAQNQIKIEGVSPINKSSYITIDSSEFRFLSDQNSDWTDNTIFARYTKNLNISANKFLSTMNDNIYAQISNNTNVISFDNVDNSNVNKNIFNLKCLTASLWSNVNNSIFANNRINISYENTTNATFSCYGIYLTSGNNNIIAYNNIYGTSFNAASKRVYGINVGSQGQTSLSNKIKNNVIYSDGYGYAMAARPSETPSNLSFDISNNLYYKTTTIPNQLLFNFNGTNQDTTAWKNNSLETNSFYDQNPLFVDIEDLIVTNIIVCGQGVGIAEITDDAFGKQRPQSNPCIGASEFEPPLSNIYVVNAGLTGATFDGINTYSACGLGQDSIFVEFKNISSNDVPASDLKFKYSVNGTTSIASVFSTNLSSVVKPDTLYRFVHPVVYDFSATNDDKTFEIIAWSELTDDTVKYNDTAYANVISYYQLPALTPINANTDYGTQATVNVTSNDSIYWFYNMSDDQPFLKGNSFITPILFSDTTYYFSRKNEIPELRITEIQYGRTSTGATNPLPAYITKDNAIEISNFGNIDMDLTGYNINMYRVTSGNLVSNNYTRTYTFPNNYILKANSSVVLVPLASVTVADSIALPAGTNFTFTRTTQHGFVLKNASGNVIDAVAINGSKFDNTLNVPTSVWNNNSSNITIATSISGIIRNNLTSNNSAGWTLSDVQPMTLGTYNSELTVATDNGCYGFKTPYNIHILQAPQIDPGISEVFIDGFVEQNCAMGSEYITVKLTNTGTESLTGGVPIVCEVYENGSIIQTIQDNCLTIIPSMDTILYTLNTPFDFSAPTADRDISIKIYTNLLEDTIHTNDTVSMTVTSLQTPTPPSMNNVTVQYANSTNLSYNSTNNSDIVLWYENDTTQTVLSIGTYQTPIMYDNDTFYLSVKGNKIENFVVGNNAVAISDGTTTTAYPSPFNTAFKNVKEQYLLLASDLLSYGLHEGDISNLAFYIQSVTLGTANPTSVNLNNYTIKVGTTSLNALSGWINDLTTVYEKDVLSFTTDSIGWKTLNFDTPFYWDGTSNLLIQICFQADNNGGRIITQKTSTLYNSTKSYRHATNNACTSNATATNTYKFIPYLSIGVESEGCESKRQPVEVILAAKPTCDAGIESITSPADYTINSGIAIPVSFEIKNYGTNNLTSATINWSVNSVPQTPYNWTGNLQQDSTVIVIVGNHIFNSGAVMLEANINVACDTTKINDSIKQDFSACIGNPQSVVEYTIQPNNTSADYNTINDAINDLKMSGICGPVIFNIASGTYNEQISIPYIIGTSDINTITFKGNANDVVLTYNPATTINNKNTVSLDSTANVYFENITIKGANAINSSVVNLKNTKNIRFNNVSFEGISTVASAVTLVKMEGNNSDTKFIADTFRYSYSALTSSVLTSNEYSEGLYIDSCYFDVFTGNGININSYDGFYFGHNKIRAYSTSIASDAIRFNKTKGKAIIESNHIYLTEGVNKDRKAMVVRNSIFDDMEPLMIYNNAITLVGAQNAKISGIDIDSSSYIYVYYNSVLVRHGQNNNNTNSKCLSIGKTSSNLFVRNNNLENQSKGYAYYVESGNNNQVVLSNNNNFYANGARMAYWNSNADNLATLQQRSGMDLQSFSVLNPFKSDSCLSLNYPIEIVRQAEPIENIANDIENNPRMVLPKPTIGAYEYIFADCDAGVLSVKNPNKTETYIENEPINIDVVVKNYGNYVASNVSVVAELWGHLDDNAPISTLTNVIPGTISSLDTVEFSFNDYFYPALNNPINDSLYLKVYTLLDCDTTNMNDTTIIKFKVVPGKDIQVGQVAAQGTGTAQCGRNMLAQPITVTISNVGSTDITSSDTIYITYEVRGQNDNLLTTATEQISFPYTYINVNGNQQTMNALQKNGSSLTYTFNTTANLYPTEGKDTVWNITVSTSLNGDNNSTNNTSIVRKYNSKMSPNAPIPQNDVIQYATWGHPSATQANSLKIQWYKDSTDTSPFYSPSTYNASTQYTTSQLYSDSTFYIRVIGSGNSGCPSFFDSVKVTVLPRCAVDLSVLNIVEPPIAPSNAYIFMENDTVKVSITNYGTQPQTNFPVTYALKPTTPANADTIYVTETCTQVVQPDDTIIYTFNTLAAFPSNTYIRAWVEANNDCANVNDSTSTKQIKPATNATGNQVQNAVSVDITRVQLANMDNSSQAFSDTYSNYMESVEPAGLFKGIGDTLYVQTEYASEQVVDENTIVKAHMKVFIDWNRDGSLSNTTELVFSDSIVIGEVTKAYINVPNNVLTGYTRMRIIVGQNMNEEEITALPGSGANSPALTGGEIEDYKILIRNRENINAELSRFVSPGMFISDNHQKIIVRLRNVGSQPLTSAQINVTINNDPTIVHNWTGNLLIGATADIEIAEKDLPFGLNKFDAYVTVQGDNYPLNDTIRRTSFIFPTYTLSYENDFDNVSNIDFYAYEQNHDKPTNCWQVGQIVSDVANNINKVITSAYSAPNCWKTNLEGDYPKNNISILYTPMFNIEQVKPDTLSFMLRKAMGSGASMVIEYLNYLGSWVRLGSKDDTTISVNWYNNDDGFTGTNTSWQKVSYSLKDVASYMGNILQLRFVFRSGNSATANGVAIDNLSLRRGLRDQDIGVVAIELMPDNLPNYGQIFYPKVTIQNYGLQEVNDFKVCYMSEDMQIPQCEDVVGLNIPVEGTAEYTFENGRYLDVSMPDPFTLLAFTRMNPTDLYADNDSAWISVVIGPLEKDAAIVEITEPIGQITPNDDVSVAIRVKNYGLTPITELPVGYVISGGNIVNETIHFNPPLNNGDEYVYHFSNTFHSYFGTVNLKAWIGLEGDYYRDNDTLYKRLEATNATQDLEAKYITVDDTEPNTLGIQLTFLNRSSVGIQNITVGYYYDGDKSTAFEEPYRQGGMITAGSYGYHMFSKRLPRKVYQSVCAYLKVDGEVYTENDTTCSLYMGYKDGVADAIYIEHTYRDDCLVQLRAHNGGTLAGNTQVVAKYVINGNYSNPVTQTFTWDLDEPNPNLVQIMEFNQRIPKSTDSIYNIVAWIEYPNDVNHYNDTTKTYYVMSFIGLDSVEQANGIDFELKQNKPNPYKDRTEIGFTIPKAGKIHFYVTNMNGQIVYSKQENYSQGRHTIVFDAPNLPQGMYYYVVEYEGKRKYKKMVIIQ